LEKKEWRETFRGPGIILHLKLKKANGKNFAFQFVQVIQEREEKKAPGG